MSVLSFLQNTKRIPAFVLYVITDFICIGAGMGVPVFSIFLGLPVGWYAARRSKCRNAPETVILRHIMSIALVTSSVTCGVMLLVWGWCIPLVFDTTYDFANFGHPMILYDPWYSFIAWLVLMIFISPFLQLLMTVFAAHVILMNGPKSSENQHTDVI